MEKVTFLESIVKILKTITSTPLLIGALVVTIILIIITSIFHIKNNKVGKIVTLCVFIATLILLPVFHISFFANSIDKIVENFVKILYFPSWYIYLIALLYTDISIFIKIKKAMKEDSRKLDIFDFIYFFIFQFLFFIIIHIVSKNDLDIFNSTELYNNSKLLSLIQVSSYIFWIRVLIQILALIINKLSNTSHKPKIIKETKKKESGGFDKIKQEDKINTDNNINVNNNIFGDFYKEPDYSAKLRDLDNEKDMKAINDLSNSYNNQNHNDEFIPVNKEEKKTYDIFNSPDIIKTNNNIENNTVNEKKEKKNTNNYGEFEIDENSNYFDDFFE